MGSSIKENATRDILAKENPNIRMIQEKKRNNQETKNIKKKSEFMKGKQYRKQECQEVYAQYGKKELGK